jgi:hypothetical protein
MPVSIDLMMIVEMLQAVGYEVTMYRKGPIDAHRKGVIRALAFSLVTPESLTEVAGYKNQQAIFDYIMGRDGMSTDKKSKIDHVINGDMLAKANQMEKELGEKIRAIVKMSNLTTESRSVSSQARPTEALHDHTPSAAPASQSVRNNGKDDPVVTSLAALILSALPLADELFNDTTVHGRARRERLRQLTPQRGGLNGVFLLSNTLNGLCSEKAKSVQTTQQ